jgi:hypothetical protein
MSCWNKEGREGGREGCNKGWKQAKKEMREMCVSTRRRKKKQGREEASNFL